MRNNSRYKPFLRVDMCPYRVVGAHVRICFSARLRIYMQSTSPGIKGLRERVIFGILGVSPTVLG
jgi:hypothetical protein